MILELQSHKKSKCNNGNFFQSSILARFQNYSKLEETSEEQLESRTAVREGKKVNDLLGSLAEDPGWLPVISQIEISTIWQLEV